ncbi:Flavohemoprotein [compost metagenome]
MSNAKTKTFLSGGPDGVITGEILKSYVDVTGDAYVCGPVPFMEAMIGELVKLGMKEEQIHYEFFGPALQLQNS